jgi:hypothetical protein
VADELSDLLIGLVDVQALVDVYVPVVVDPLLYEWHFELGLEPKVLVAHELHEALAWRLRLVKAELAGLNNVFCHIPGLFFLIFLRFIASIVLPQRLVRALDLQEVDNPLLAARV